jgi:uncharacterized protein YheU (UPF0270 family)
MEVPYASLQTDTLRRVVEEFVTRAGTDYGERERTLEEKIADVVRQLEHGEAKLVFDLETNAVNIVPVKMEIDGAGTQRSVGSAHRQRG